MAADLDLGLQVEEVQAARRAGVAVAVAVRDLAHPTLLPASHARLHAWRTPL